jgi:hypothetical protein
MASSARALSLLPSRRAASLDSDRGRTSASWFSGLSLPRLSRHLARLGRVTQDVDREAQRVGKSEVRHGRFPWPSCRRQVLCRSLRRANQRTTFGRKIWRVRRPSRLRLQRSGDRTIGSGEPAPTLPSQSLAWRGIASIERRQSQRRIRIRATNLAVPCFPIGYVAGDQSDRLARAGT